MRTVNFILDNIEQPNRKIWKDILVEYGSSVFLLCGQVNWKKEDIRESQKDFPIHVAAKQTIFSMM